VDRVKLSAIAGVPEKTFSTAVNSLQNILHNQIDLSNPDLFIERLTSISQSRNYFASISITLFFTAHFQNTRLKNPTSSLFKMCG
jgi:chemotaxis protein CheY-P-specific phosphatase CheC